MYSNVQHTHSYIRYTYIFFPAFCIAAARGLLKLLIEAMHILSHLKLEIQNSKSKTELTGSKFKIQD